MKNNSKAPHPLSPPASSESGMNVVAGLDLGDKHSVVCLLDLDGQVVEQKRLRTTMPAFQRYFGPWMRMRVVFEAGGPANWVYRLLERLGHQPLMADTHRLALITQSLSKDDRTDAERLAQLGLRMPAMLNPVEPCSLETQRHRTLLRTREALVGTRTKLINSVRGVLKSFGQRLPACSAEAFARKAGPLLPAELRPTLSPLLQLIQHASDEIRRADRTIAKLAAETYPQTRRLRSLRGVGPVTSLAFVLNLDNNPQRLRRSRDAGARVGLRPQRRQSGSRAPELSITKTGDALLRRLLVQCAQYIRGRHGEDSALRRWGLQLAARGGKSAQRKAVVAVARKLAVLLHVLWQRDVDFDPFYGVPAEAGPANA